MDIKRKSWLVLGKVLHAAALPYMSWFEKEYNCIIVGLPNDKFPALDFEADDDLITTDIPQREDMN